MRFNHWRGKFIHYLKAVPYVRPIAHKVLALYEHLQSSSHLSRNIFKLYKQLRPSCPPLSRIHKFPDGYGSAIKGLENCVRRHEILLNEIQTYLKINERDLNEKSNYHYAVNNFTTYTRDRSNCLNLGCGNNPISGYINVDKHSLPGVDLIGDVLTLPFKSKSINTILMENFITYFPTKIIQDTLLPYLFDLLMPGGKIIIVVPDASAAIQAYSTNQICFNQLHKIIFGGYQHDSYSSMFSAETLVSFLQNSGFSSIEVAKSKRSDNNQFTIRIEAQAMDDKNKLHALSN